MLEKYDPELIVVVAYGRILPRYVLTYPRRGCINVHGSLLPKYRGSAPIQWAVIRGEKTTGVTTMFMDEGMDTGDILLKREIAIADTDTAAAVYAKLAPLGADLLSQTLADLQAGRLTRIPQDSAQATYAPMLDKRWGILILPSPAPQFARWCEGSTLGRALIRLSPPGWSRCSKRCPADRSRRPRARLSA